VNEAYLEARGEVVEAQPGAVERVDGQHEDEVGDGGGAERLLLERHLRAQVRALQDLVWVV
jgi:hypothetical protein